MIESHIQSTGYTVQEWRNDEDYSVPRAVAYIGRFEIIEDDEDNGLYSGDEGDLTATVVGAAEYQNERVAFSFTPDGYDTGTDVPDLSLVDPI